MPPDANAAVDAVYHSDWGRIVATLIRLVRDFDVAEEAAQEAFTAAVDQWRVSGVPEIPRAWIIQTARHKAIDRIRRRVRFGEKLDAYTAAGSVITSDVPEGALGVARSRQTNIDGYAERRRQQAAAGGSASVPRADLRGGPQERDAQESGGRAQGG